MSYKIKEQIKIDIEKDLFRVFELESVKEFGGIGEKKSVIVSLSSQKNNRKN